MLLDTLLVPIVLAPLAGGPFTPELAAAVSNAGGLGFVAAGYLSAADFERQLQRTEQLTDSPIAANLFVPGQPTALALYADYLQELAGEAHRAAVNLGVPSFDDDDWEAKIEVVAHDRTPVVSFTFGLPPTDVISRMKGAGAEIWMTVTSPDEALQAAVAGADVLVVQGIEAGGHQARFLDSDAAPGYALLPLLQLVRAEVPLPMVATGGITTGAALAAVLCAGAAAAQVGSGFLRATEAGTSDVHRAAVAGRSRTQLTRAFTGRTARGVRNRFIDDHDARAPIAYPEIHYATGPIRKAGRQKGDADLVNLWAGQAHQFAEALPAADIVRLLTEGAREAVDRAKARLPI